MAAHPAGSAQARQRQTTEAHRRLFTQATAFIAHTYGDPDLSLGVVAWELGTSERQLQRVFRAVGQTSFSRYVARLRMERAIELLRAGTSSRHVAQHVGYRHPAGFAKAFRRYWGFAPYAVHEMTADVRASSPSAFFGLKHLPGDTDDDDGQKDG